MFLSFERDLMGTQTNANNGLMCLDDARRDALFAMSRGTTKETAIELEHNKRTDESGDRIERALGQQVVVRKMRAIITCTTRARTRSRTLG